MVDGRDVIPEVHAVLARNDRVLPPSAKWSMDRSYREAHPECSQYRHRRLRSRARNGLRSSQAF
jgi:hypothetical protein